MPNPGALNLITDISGVLVGHATDDKANTGVTVLRCEHAMKAAVDVRGGAPGTRETDVLAPENLVHEVQAVVLSGGSVFGLAAADGVAAELSHQGVGLHMTDSGPAIPIVPAAVLHDLGYAGDKNWGATPPYQQLGRDALGDARTKFALGTIGAGKGARAGTVAGGIGSASIDLGDGVVVGALAAVNSLGSALLADGETFHAWLFEQNGEFGNQAPPTSREIGDPFPELGRLTADGRFNAGANTTLAIVVTTVDLTSTELKRVAMMAHDGVARAIRPSHTSFDGDIVFALSSGAVNMTADGAKIERPVVVTRIGSAAADCLARAIARGVFEARHVD